MILLSAFVKDLWMVREELLTLDLVTILREELVYGQADVLVVGGVKVGDGAAWDAQSTANFNVD